jgi:hypothetical protein
VNLHTEIIDLASEGYFYPSGSLLSSGTVKILPITAWNEELLGNSNLIRRGLVEKDFLNSVVEGGVNFDELLYCDKLSILLNLRIANYGAQTKIKVKCDACDNEYDQDISFSFRGIPINFFGCERGKNKLRYTFPKCKKHVWFKLPTVNEQEIYEKHGWLTFIKYLTLSVDGIEDSDDFFDNTLSATDSAAFRSYYEKNMPGYDNRVVIKCPSCEVTKKTRMEVNFNIFGIRPESTKLIHSEIFDLCYYSNGAFTQDGVYNMPTSLRSFYIQKLVDTKKAEEEAQKNASSGPSSGKIARPPAVKS